MSKIAVGSIPKKISYVASEEREVMVGCEWDIDHLEREDSPSNIKIKVLPTFPVDSLHLGDLSKAISWATSGYYDSDLKQTIARKHTITERENKPIKDIRVLSLQKRGDGRAYKALIDNFYVDLREDVLMDTLLQVGVEPGGILKGEYVWAKMGTNTKLVRVGSELHRLIVEFDSKKDWKPISKKELEIGGVYRDRKKNAAIFIGYVSGTTFKSENTRSFYNRQTSDFKFIKTPFKNNLLFYQYYDFEKFEDALRDMKENGSSYRFDIKKTHKYIEKINQVVIPDDIVSYLRNYALSGIKNKLLEYTGHRPPKSGYSKIPASFLEEAIAHDSPYLNLYEAGKTAPELFDIKKYLILS